MESREPSWSGALADLLLVTCVVVPCVFTTRLDAVFAVPKLVVLWAVLALSLVLVAVGCSSRRSAVGSSGDRECRHRRGRVPRAQRRSVDLVVGPGQSLYGERRQYQGLLTILLYIGLFYVARLAFSTEHRLRQLFWAVAIGASFVSGYALVQKAGLDPVWDGYLPEGRVFSSIGQANALAAYLVLAIPVTVALLDQRRLPLRAVSLAAFLAMTAALALTQSRGGYLGLLAAAVVLVAGLRERLRPHARWLAQIGAACLAAVIGVVVLSGATDATFKQPVRRPLSIGDESVRFHVDAWHVAIRIAAEHPLLGRGRRRSPKSSRVTATRCFRRSGRLRSTPSGSRAPTTSISESPRVLGSRPSSRMSASSLRSFSRLCERRERPTPTCTSRSSPYSLRPQGTSSRMPS